MSYAAIKVSALNNPDSRLLPTYIGLLGFAPNNMLSNGMAIQIDGSSTLCGSAAWTFFTIYGIMVSSPQDNVIATSYAVSCPAEGGDVIFMTFGQPQFATTTAFESYNAYLTNRVAASDIRLWVETNSLVPVNKQFAFTSNGSCIAAGHPAGASGSSLQYGSLAVYCLQSGSYVAVQAPFNVPGSSGFGTAVQFYANDTRLVASAPGSGTVYVFAFDPIAQVLTSTTPILTYTGATGVGFGNDIAFTPNWQAIAAPSTTLCGSSGSNSGTVYVYANVTDCIVSDWTPTSACSASCGNGTYSASRTISSPAQNGGAACPSLTGTLSCVGTTCPVDCQLSDWIVSTA
jgi:hypothetical protein